MKHEIVRIHQDVGGLWHWICNCKKAGRSSQAYDGEDVKAKAKKNGNKHVRLATKKEEV